MLVNTGNIILLLFIIEENIWVYKVPLICEDLCMHIYNMYSHSSIPCASYLRLAIIDHDDR